MFEYVPGVFPVFALLELPFRSYVLSYVFAVFRVFALLELLAKTILFAMVGLAALSSQGGMVQNYLYILML